MCPPSVRKRKPAHRRSSGFRSVMADPDLKNASARRCVGPADPRHHRTKAFACAYLTISNGWRIQRPRRTFNNAVVADNGRIDAIPMFGAAAAPEMAMAV